jgi:hypothetical protein
MPRVPSPPFSRPLGRRGRVRSVTHNRDQPWWHRRETHSLMQSSKSAARPAGQRWPRAGHPLAPQGLTRAGAVPGHDGSKNSVGHCRLWRMRVRLGRVVEHSLEVDDDRRLIANNPGIMTTR